MSFTRKISQKNKSELTSVNNSIFIPDGVYILHETLGVRTVDGWNPEDNEGVVGILVIEDDHKIVVALEDAPQKLIWSKKRELVNEPIEKIEDAKSDFNGEYYCRNLNSPDFPAAYYCLNYKKGGLEWYLPSSGELWLIFQNLETAYYDIYTQGSRDTSIKILKNYNVVDYNDDNPYIEDDEEDCNAHLYIKLEAGYYYFLVYNYSSTGYIDFVIR